MTEAIPRLVRPVPGAIPLRRLSRTPAQNPSGTARNVRDHVTPPAPRRENGGEGSLRSRWLVSTLMQSWSACQSNPTTDAGGMDLSDFTGRMMPMPSLVKAMPRAEPTVLEMAEPEIQARPRPSQGDAASDWLC